MSKKSLQIAALPGYEPEIGRWLWCLGDVRRTILEKLNGLEPDLLDQKVEGKHSIGSLLYHIALIEADWLYVEVLETDFEPEIRSLFPQDDRSEDGALVHVAGQTLEQHLHRLQAVRDRLLFHFKGMDLTDWRTPRQLEAYDVTPEWVIYHLVEHEAHHRGQIFELLRNLREQREKA
ncbi:DinB family protein [Paenibacillus sp. P96]|uniref:DinB family protein n=1 Tax=Paenibacillus zeirhizosphaerae TaxID=2987519 RepID=A0ABT9FTZ6_9BACL|nr:DinB family protein [Paenibacillus sp. P96]MDP4097976.1 DinB family protein [Paenibacillus sp. P96]